MVYPSLSNRSEAYTKKIMRLWWGIEVLDSFDSHRQNFEKECGNGQLFYRETIDPMVAHKYRIPVTIYHILGV